MLYCKDYAIVSQSIENYADFPQNISVSEVLFPVGEVLWVEGTLRIRKECVYVYVREKEKVWV